MCKMMMMNRTVCATALTVSACIVIIPMNRIIVMMGSSLWLLWLQYISRHAENQQKIMKEKQENSRDKSEIVV